MKAKLLKRLRKEAKRKYIIKQNRDGYHVCEQVYISCFYHPYIIKFSFKSMGFAQYSCNAERRAYIINEVRLRRNNHKRTIY